MKTLLWSGTLLCTASVIHWLWRQRQARSLTLFSNVLCRLVAYPKWKFTGAIFRSPLYPLRHHASVIQYLSNHLAFVMPYDTEIEILHTALTIALDFKF